MVLTFHTIADQPHYAVYSEAMEAYFRDNPALPAASVFGEMWVSRGGDIMAEDLAGAGIEAENEAGEVLDFHSLRHTCGTRLARNGVLPQVAMRIMRHSTMDLTLKYYTHLALGDKASALAKLPVIHTAESVAMRTGTEDLDEKTLMKVDRKRDRFSGPRGGI